MQLAGGLLNISHFVERAADRRPDQPAIFFENRSITYRELEQHASQMAHWLEDSGIVAGDRLAIFLPNIPEFAIVYLGTQKLGAIAVSVSSLLTATELEHALRDCGARVLFTTEALLGAVAPIHAGLPQLEHVLSCEGGSVHPWVSSLNAALEGRSRTFAARERAPGDPASILYTSGTTGKPKGAVLSHGNLSFNAQSMARCLRAEVGDRHLLCRPLAHCFGQNAIMNVGFCSVGTLVMQRGYQRDATVAEIHRHEVSHLYGVPSMYIELLHVGIEPAQLASVRVYFSAAASMPREVAQLWRERYGSPIHEGYGLTETSPLATFNHTHDHRLGSIGTPIDDVELMIVDDQQRPAADEERGEICIRGPNVMSGYHGRAQDTAEVLRDGWFHSGDVGYRDAAGYYYIVDRLKDMINRGGAKVWPREVEEVLYQHDAVAECAVVGRADPSLGERVVAYVRLKPDHSAVAHDLREHCLRQLAEFKTPEEFVFDVELPKNAGGKILKRLLRS